MKSEIIRKLIKACGKKHVLTENWSKETYCKGWRYGSGHAIAVVKPGTLLEIWKVLNVCNDSNLVIIMQAANTGLTGGSTPYGEDYDRDIVIINTMRINDIHLLDNYIEPKLIIKRLFFADLLKVGLLKSLGLHNTLNQIYVVRILLPQ